MRRSFSLLILLVSALSGQAQVKTTLRVQNLQGAVKSVTVRTYTLSEGGVKKLHKKVNTQYSSTGFKTQETVYFEEDTTRGHTTNYTYDHEGHLTGKNGYSSNGSDNAVWEVKYTKHNHEAHIKEFDEKGKEEQEEVHIYDDLGNETEFICYFGDAQQYKLTYEYDKAGNMTAQNQKYVENYDGSDHPDKVIYTYKEDGVTLVMKSDRYFGSGADHEITYEYGRYDKFENWLQRTAMDRSKVHDVTERQIEYY